MRPRGARARIARATEAVDIDRIMSVIRCVCFVRCNAASPQNFTLRLHLESSWRAVKKAVEISQLLASIDTLDGVPTLVVGVVACMHTIAVIRVGYSVFEGG